MLFKREKRGRGWLISEACRKARALNQWYQETMSLDDIQYFVWMNAFGRSTCTGKTSLWIFMTPIWAPKNKAWVSISLVEGASAPDDFDVVVVFAAAPLRIFDISRYLSMRCDSIAVKTFWIIVVTTQLSDGVVRYTTIEQCFYAGFTNGVICTFSIALDRNRTILPIGPFRNQTLSSGRRRWFIAKKKGLSEVFPTTGRLETNCL